MDALIQSGLSAGLFYGAEVLVARGSKVEHHRAYGTFDGTRTLEKNAIFDVASLTKPVATASLLLALGLPLDSLVSRYIPAFTGGGKGRVTLRHLAAHLSGLPATVRFIESCLTPEETFQALLNVPLEAPPGTAVTYSCLGYMLLGKVLEAHTGHPLNALFKQHIAQPAGMADSGFLPILSERLVPSGNRPHSSGALGVVNDSNAWLLGGVSGNAGLFATASDLQRFSQWMLHQNWPPMLANQAPEGAVPRSIGFEIHSPTQPAGCGLGFPFGAIGHTGFTGTSLWIEPNTALTVILLTNRTAVSHRAGLAAMKRFRLAFHQVAV